MKTLTLWLAIAFLIFGSALIGYYRLDILITIGFGLAILASVLRILTHLLGDI